MRCLRGEGGVGLHTAKEEGGEGGDGGGVAHIVDDLADIAEGGSHLRPPHAR